MVDSIDNQCMNCFRCVQGCPKELIHKSANPEFKALGDRHWTPDIIARLWYQAETGKIPVSGAGYPGPFSGRGVRRHVDGHVRDRAAHKGRHSRP